jgi:hypothetical protein
MPKINVRRGVYQGLGTSPFISAMSDSGSAVVRAQRFGWRSDIRTVTFEPRRTFSEARTESLSGK